jgi:hypothetical protein
MLIDLGKKKVVVEEKSGGVKGENRPQPQNFMANQAKNAPSAARRITKSESPPNGNLNRLRVGPPNARRKKPGRSNWAWMFI